MVLADRDDEEPPPPAEPAADRRPADEPGGGTTYERGMAVRRAVLGDAHVDRAADDEFSAEFSRFVTEHDVVGIVVGLPRTLAGREGPAAEAARAFAEALTAHVPVPIAFSDERLTTVVATRQMRESGRKGRRQRAVVDQVAAVAILQGWLDSRR